MGCDCCSYLAGILFICSSLISPIYLVLIGILVLLVAILVGIVFLSKDELKLRKLNPDSEAEFEGRRLYFASIVLIGVGLLFVLSMTMYYFEEPSSGNSRGKEIFDSCKTILPPIATLVLGFYFGKSASGQHKTTVSSSRNISQLPPGSRPR